MVKVKLFANFREVVGKKEVEIDAKDVEELIDKLIKNYPEMKELISREDYLHIMVNGIHINFLQQFKTKLNKNDKVAIFPPVSGG